MITIGFQASNVTLNEADGSFTACIVKDLATAVEFNVFITTTGDPTGKNTVMVIKPRSPFI